MSLVPVELGGHSDEIEQSELESLNLSHSKLVNDITGALVVIQYQQCNTTTHTVSYVATMQYLLAIINLRSSTRKQKKMCHSNSHVNVENKIRDRNENWQCFTTLHFVLQHFHVSCCYSNSCKQSHLTDNTVSMQHIILYKYEQLCHCSLQT